MPADLQRMMRLARPFRVAAALVLAAATAQAHDSIKSHDGGWDAMMSRSEVARDLGDMATSRGFLEHALEKEPKGLPAVITHSQLAEIHILTGNYDKAREASKAGLAYADKLQQLPQLRGQLHESMVHALHKTGGDKAEIERNRNWAEKIRQDSNSPLVMRVHDFGLRHTVSGFVFGADIAGFLRTNARKVDKDAPHVEGRYARWLGKSAVFANIVIYPKRDTSLRQAFDQSRALTNHVYKKAQRLAKGDFAAAEALGIKGLEAQWLVTEPEKKIELWQGTYLMERKGYIIQVRARALGDKAEQAAKMIDEFVRAFKWADPV